jgi:general secretion pathway protein D
VDKTRTGIVGVQLPQTATVFNITSELNSVIASNSSLVQQIISSGLANAGDLAAIAAILIASGEVSGSVLGQPFASFGNGLTLTGIAPSGVNGNLSFNSADTRVLDEVQLRLEDNAEGTIRSGTRYPITTSSYSSIASSSVSIPGITSAGLSSVLSGLGVSASSLASVNPIPQVQYEDLGLTLKVTPRVERSDDVALKLDFKIQALQGSSLNGLPVLTNQSYTADIILRNGASALVVGDMTRQQSNAVSGTPGLSELPGFAALSSTTKSFDISNLAILVTPHILRRRHTGLVGPVIPLPPHS